ncbi:hypothetical protein ACHAXN_008205 [Cyclotella atomus]|jgi:hypothetical protein
MTIKLNLGHALLTVHLLAINASTIISGSHRAQKLQPAFAWPSKIKRRTQLFQSRYDSSFYGKRGKGNSTRDEAASMPQKLANLFGSTEQFVPLSLAGRCTKQKNGVALDILLLSDSSSSKLIKDAYNSQLQSENSRNRCISAIAIPLSPNSPTRLLSHAYASIPLSKTKMLILNSLLVNRDNGLFDNLPWASWTIEPERDAASNVVDEKYSMGKRVAYQRLMGKDWRGRLTTQLKELLEKKEDNDIFANVTDEEMMASLSKRILEVEVTDARAQVAEFEQQQQVVNGDELEWSDFMDSESEAFNQQLLDEARFRLQIAESSLKDLNDKPKGPGSVRSTLMTILTSLNVEVKEAPYRGAIGYPPKRNDPGDLAKPYTSPYSLLTEIISEQLNAEVVACVLEQTSLFEGNLVLGGALVLQRKGSTKGTTAARNYVGNEVVSPHSLYVAECYSDEAVGMAVEAGLPIHLEGEVWKRVIGTDVEIDSKEAFNARNNTAMSRLPILRPLYDFYTAVEGEEVLSKQDANSIRLPISTSASIFDKGIQMIQPSSDTSNAPVFSTYSPVGSLDEYDSLSDDDKARILLKLESFQGVLPRPRVVRTSVPSALDELLLPLIDESVRRQFLIRDAEERNDVDTANALRAEMSPRQALLERAQAARELGLNDEAQRLENEAEMLKATRADFSQDEGAYNRFLDRDDWYERETQARIARYKKSQGIE